MKQKSNKRSEITGQESPNRIQKVEEKQAAGKPEETTYGASIKIEKYLALHSNSLTVLATIVTAIATLLYFIATLGMLVQMRGQLQTMKNQAIQDASATLMQSEYYQKTIRPFVYCDSIAAPTIYIEETDTTTRFIYFVKNEGSQPAKDVRAGLMLIDKEDKQFPFELGTSPSITLYPGNVKILSSQTFRISCNTVRKNPYAHVMIKYKDIGDREYVFKAIFHIKKFENDKIFASIWQDFN